MNYQRYAVYFAPRAGTELAEFGRQWLGTDAETKEVLEAPTPYVDSPRRYGFHATLKAPMRLAPDTTYDNFRHEVEALANELSPVDLGVLILKSIGSFLALVTEQNYHSAVSELAWRTVTSLDHLRAELSDAERNKRPNLSQDEANNLETWGYPYVGDRFRFHMTLTSSLGEAALKHAKDLLEPITPKVQTHLDSLCIFGDPGASKPFELVERFDLNA